MRSLLCGAVCVVLLACNPRTTFHGDAKFPGGVDACRRTCASSGLELGGFVYSGEFATSCVCQAPHADSSAANRAESSPAAGVFVQMQAAAAAAAASNTQQWRMQQEQSRSLHHY